MRFRPIPALLACLLLLSFCSKGSLTRSLKQDAQEIEITADNVRRLARLVENVNRDTVFIFRTDVELPSLITIRTEGVTFRGAVRNRPTIRCSPGEGAFRVHANNTAFKNLVIRDCEQTAVLVANELEPFNPFDPDSVRDEPNRIDVLIRRVDFVSNAASGDERSAGALVATEMVHVQLSGCRFEGNTGISGGAVRFSGSSLSLDDCVFMVNNASHAGGAIYAFRDSQGSVSEPDTTVMMSNCEFRENRDLGGGEDPSYLTGTQGIHMETNRYLDFPFPTSSGGAVYVVGFQEVTFEFCNFTQNSAVPAGGAVFVGDNREITIAACLFLRNFVLAPPTAPNGRQLQLGGAIFAAFVENKSSLRIRRCLFTGNNASYGGALHFVGAVDSTFHVENCAFRRNVGSLGGGAAVLRNAETSTVMTSEFANNSAFVGGAILLTNGAGLDMLEANDDARASTFVDNVAYDGGAIFGIGGGTLKLNRIFFERNLAERNGGAVCYIDSKASGALTVQDARMFRNRADTGGAIFVENVAEFTLVPGARGFNEAFLRGRQFNPYSLFRKNVAVAGGAIYYHASNSLQNRFLFSDTRFVDNRAVSTLSLVHAEQLNYPRVDRGLRRLLQRGAEDRDAAVSTEPRLLDPKSSQPCYPGGGAGICAVLSGTGRRASVSLEGISSNFTGNAADVGGALLIASDPSAGWTPRCSSNQTAADSILTSRPCRSQTLRDLRFDSNRADGAGGAIFATDLHHTFFSTVQQDNGMHNFEMLNETVIEEKFTDNRVGESGYGPDIAGTAVRLKISYPERDSGARLPTIDEASYQSSLLERVEVQVLDGLDQVVSGGIVDSALSIQADAFRPGDDFANALRQVVSSAERGVVVFEASALTAEPGQYDVKFSVRGTDVVGASRNFTLRECVLGERFVANSSICERCPVDEFTFYDEVSDCLDCPEHAKCNGGASLVPMKGYWHSSPFSIVMHECFHEDACSYRDREDKLNQQRSENLDEFFERFDQDELPAFANEEYQQCADGYEGLLCGSCQNGYGRADGLACIKCGSRSGIIAVVFLLAVWQLLLLGLTVRSALECIQDMNQMMVLQQQGSNADVAESQATTSVDGTSNVAPAMATSQRQSTVQGMELAQCKQTNGECSASATARQAVLDQQHSVECVIASQHLTEVIKIFVNFFQITSVALHINLGWTDATKNMLGTMNALAGFSNGSMVVPTTCLFDQDAKNQSVHGVVLRIMVPLCLLVIALAVFCVRWLLMRLSGGVSPGNYNGYLGRRITLTFTVFAFFVYQSFSESLIGTISCFEIDAEDMSKAERHDDQEEIDFSRFSIATDHYWTLDTDVKCYSGRHTPLVAVLGIPGIVLFVCGLPLYFLMFLLHKRQKEKLMELNLLSTFGFIYQNYQDKLVHWEVFIFIRKALVSVIVVFAYPLGAGFQGILALGVLIAALAFHLVAAPFKHFPLNALEGCSLVVSVFTFYAGLMFHDKRMTDEGEVLLSTFFIAVNIIFAFVFCGALYVSLDKYVVARLKMKNERDIPGHSFPRMMLLISAHAKEAFEDVSNSMREIFKSLVNAQSRYDVYNDPPQSSSANSPQHPGV